MKNLAIIAAPLLLLAGCAEAPAEDSPVAPEAVCEEFTSDGDQSLECNTYEAEVNHENTTTAETGN
jgi:PBP1b-binding outer membrane lipoprotein LpoB